MKFHTAFRNVDPQIDWAAEPDLPTLREAHRLLGTDPCAAQVQLRSLAARGSTMSLLYLGGANRKGMFGQVDLVEAERCYARAAAAGSVMGNHALGRLHYDQQNYAAAFKEYAFLASKDYPPALHSLARLYWLGLGTKKDISRAEDLLTRAAKLGSPISRGLLGRILIEKHSSWHQTLHGIWLVITAMLKLLIVPRIKRKLPSNK